MPRKRQFNIPQPALVKIDFNRFRVLNPNSQNAFEDLCYFLFCRKYRASEGLFKNRNQAGLESEPVTKGKDTIGWQAKHFDHTIDHASIIDSLEKAKERHSRLTKVVLYFNIAVSESSKKAGGKSEKRKAIEDTAKKLGISLDWFVPSNFQIVLNRPENLDLAQLYFGAADELGFIRSSVIPRVQTFLRSREYLTLPVTAEGKVVSRYGARIIQSKSRTFLIIGQPGCGKSILMHELLRELGGLGKPTSAEMIKALVKNGAVPMLINLKDCASASLEDLIRKRQQDANVRGHQLGFVYLLDGLDELSGENADQILSYIRSLENQQNTKKIVLSCRSGNANRIRARGYLPNIVEWQFGALSSKDIDRYFAVKTEKGKSLALGKLRTQNAKLLSEIRDILLVSLLWNTIEKLDETSTIADVLQLQIDHLLRSMDHRKNIESLNVLDDKAERIVELNQEIAFTFQTMEQYRFSRDHLQDIVLRLFPKIDYRSANELLDYQSNLFFETNYAGGTTASSFVYRHRRLQEFFLAQRLMTEYEKAPTVLRTRDILSNRDFLEGLLLPYMRRQYERRQDLIGLLDLNLLDVYLGRHRGFGVDDAYYLTSTEFIPALARQQAILLDQFLYGEGIGVARTIEVDLAALDAKFSAWHKDPKGYGPAGYLSSVWEEGVGALLEHIAVLWKAGKCDLAKTLVNNLDAVTKRYEKQRFFEKVAEHHKPRDPYWKYWEQFMFLLVVIRQSDPKKILDKLVRENYWPPEHKPVTVPGEEEGNEKLFKGYGRVVLRYGPASLLSELIDYSDLEFTYLLDILSTPEFLSQIKNESLLSEIAKELKRRKIAVTADSLSIVFFKTLVGIRLSKTDRTTIENTKKQLLEEERMEWRFREVATKFAIVSFALGENGADTMRPDPKSTFRYYNELALYAGLFASLVAVLRGQRTLAQTVTDYISYCQHHNERSYSYNYLRTQIGQLWAFLFIASSPQSVGDLIGIKHRLLKATTQLNARDFLYALCFADPTLFDRIVNESDLIEIESRVQRTDEHQSLVNECFALSMFYARLNQDKSRTYFIRGMTDSILRHGWRKDSLVSYDLVESLEILWRNNWETRDRLVALTNEVFDLTVRVTQITDGKGTWQGPYNVVEAVAKYDLELAESLKGRLLNTDRDQGVNNRVITSVLLAKVQLGIDVQEIEKGMNQFRLIRDYEGKPRPDSYEQRLKVYVALAESTSYLETERGAAFLKAYELVDAALTGQVEYFLNDSYFRELKNRYLRLCEKYGKTPNVTIGPEEKRDSTPIMSEDEFQTQLRKANSKAKVLTLYKKLQKYENHIVLSRQDTWQLLVEQTFKVMHNIQPFIRMLQEYSYPHMDFYTTNSQFLHFGLAAALSNPEMRPEAVEHCKRHTGHGGFSNMIKVCEVMGDSRMARKTFSRFLQLCHFLVE